MDNMLQNKCVNWQGHGAMKTRVHRVVLEARMPRGMEAHKEPSKPDLTEDSTSTYTHYHMLCMGLS